MYNLSSKVLSRLTRAVLGVAMIMAAGCAPIEEGELDDVTTIEQKVTIEWQNLNLINGWVGSSSNPPRVARMGDVIVFRGAMYGWGAQTNLPFYLPNDFKPSSPDFMVMRVGMGNQTTGKFAYTPDGGGIPTVDRNSVRIIQNGLGREELGNGKGFVSLDGVSFDRDSSSMWYNYTGGDIGKWAPHYGHRAHAGNPDPFYVGLIADQVRMMGAILAGSGKATNDRYLFRLPAGLRPENNVYLPVALGKEGSADAEAGRVFVRSDGHMWVYSESGSMSGANDMISFEGVGFSLSNFDQNITLTNGWSAGAWNTRPAKARSFGQMVFLEGGISGGTSNVIGTLPATWLRPASTIYISLDAMQATPGRIRIDPNGTMRIDIPNLSTASQFVSLEGVSFGIPFP